MSRNKDKAVKESQFCGCITPKQQRQITVVINEEVVPATKIIATIMQGQSVTRYLRQCRLNPNLDLQGFREDLEFYIPQIIAHILKLSDDTILEFIIEAAEVDFYFAHTFYFAWRSVVSNKRPEVENFLKLYLQTISRKYENTLLIAAKYEDFEFKNGIYQQISRGIAKAENAEIPSHLADYGTLFYSQQGTMSDPLILPNYTSVFRKLEPTGFCSTIDFWDDIIHIAQNLHKANPKLISLRADIQLINKSLPAAVYIPFQSTRNYVILNILYEECKVYSTKTRSPFYLCFELYRPEEEADTIPNPFRMSRLSQARVVGMDRKSHQSVETQVQCRPTLMMQPIEEECDSFVQNDLTTIMNDKEITRTYAEDLKHVVERPLKQGKQVKTINILDQLFDCTQPGTQSPFRTYRSWKLAHVIVKCGDDLRQEQFAMQLVTLCDWIFKAEDLPLKLTTYEVISLGPGYGLIERVQDAVSVDHLKQRLFELTKCKSLAQYYSMLASQRALHNFVNSLAAYSVLAYILQIKDRHNGNILIHKDGQMVHIDFGFFLSGAPKGNLENTVPFKMPDEYVDILGGVGSNLFTRFRRHFYDGLRAMRKHKDKILLLVGAMQMSDMGCFASDTLARLDARFLDAELSDTDLFVKAMKLIDKSVDNWRARWYDKYQYYFQGIFY